MINTYVFWSTTLLQFQIIICQSSAGNIKFIIFCRNKFLQISVLPIHESSNPRKRLEISGHNRDQCPNCQNISSFSQYSSGSFRRLLQWTKWKDQTRIRRHSVKPTPPKTSWPRPTQNHFKWRSNLESEKTKSTSSDTFP